LRTCAARSALVDPGTAKLRAVRPEPRADRRVKWLPISWCAPDDHDRDRQETKKPQLLNPEEIESPSAAITRGAGSAGVCARAAPDPASTPATASTGTTFAIMHSR
jgi:hypothetical protein